MKRARYSAMLAVVAAVMLTAAACVPSTGQPQVPAGPTAGAATSISGGAATSAAVVPPTVTPAVITGSGSSAAAATPGLLAPATSATGTMLVVTPGPALATSAAATIATAVPALATSGAAAVSTVVPELATAVATAGPSVATSSAAAVTTAGPALATSSAASVATLAPGTVASATPSGATTAGATALPLGTPTPGVAPGTGGALASVSDLQTTLEQIYDTVNPSVVNIQVIIGETTGGPEQGTVPVTPVAPDETPNPHLPGGPLPLPQQAVGSGFVWDAQGHIVTNNHVVEGASRIVVTFASGVEVPAELVGRDPDSDLAVIKVDPTGLTLAPLKVGDSTKARPGQFVVAIGNPFGLEGSMTFGIISAVGRSLPTQAQDGQGLNQPTYTIPDIIQTDAPINPGNSGGVLLDLQGQLLGVPTAIESSLRVNSGVGFAVPSAIVQNVVPALIQTGRVEHPYLGISGTTLSPDMAQAMGLPATQRGALVIEVAEGGPAQAAGLRGSDRRVTINGITARVGGDVIVRIDDHVVRQFDDIPAYLARNTKVGQTVRLTILRGGQQTTVDVRLGNRPTGAAGQATTTPGTVSPAPGTSTPLPGMATSTPSAGMATPGTSTPVPGFGTPTPGATLETPGTGTPSISTATPGIGTSIPSIGTATPGARGGTWLGIVGRDLTPQIAQALNLNASQRGVVVEQVAPDSPAERAGLRGATPDAADVIVSVDGTAVGTIAELAQLINSRQPGDQITLRVLRQGTQIDVSVTLAARPAGS